MEGDSVRRRRSRLLSLGWLIEAIEQRVSNLDALTAPWSKTSISDDRGWQKSIKNGHDTERQNGLRWERNVRSLLVVLDNSFGSFTNSAVSECHWRSRVVLPFLNVSP